jgi:hypothetical protein
VPAGPLFLLEFGSVVASLLLPRSLMLVLLLSQQCPAAQLSVWLQLVWRMDH